VPGVSTLEPPPPHVRSTFGLREVDGEPWGRGWRFGDVVLTAVDDHVRATWSAGVRQTLQVEGVRLARPVRSSDGRWVVSGWSADTFLAGDPEPRHDEVVAVAGRLHAATAALPCPRFLTPAVTAVTADVLTTADRVAWGEELEPFTLTPGPAAALEPTSVTVFRNLARARRRVHGTPQVVHGDLFGTVLFAGSADPGIAELTPYWHPPSWAAAVAVVDAVAWGGADDGLLDRWSELAEWPQMLLRAALFRLAVHTLHERSTPQAFPGLERTAQLVRERV
jgi:uncharacterized protein (TIGR02569 family)